jgi:hypothetical protein
MRRFLQKDKGNALILGALSFAVLAAFGVLTIDIGRMYVTKNQLQNAADAAALAGASLYCSAPGNPTDDEVKNRAILIGQAHKALAMGPAAFVSIPPSDVTITQPEGTTSHRVDVETRSTTQQYFLRLLNAKNWFVGSQNNINGAKTGDNVTAVAAAQCGATCGVSCLKPWSPPDRWDDVTPVPGYNGGKNGNWANNNQWDREDWTDTNGNGLYDPGEPFVDKNNNGTYDQEAYSPTLTGYVPDPVAGNSLAPNGDLGLEITLHFAQGNANTPVAGQYQSIDLPPINRGTPVTGGDQYRENIASCNQSEVWPGDWLQLEPGAKVGPTNQGMRDLIAQDPDAYWDSITQSVQGSAFAVSPRIVLIPLYDPRIPAASGRNQIQVTKVAAFFMEQMTGQSEVIGRFLKVRAPGEPCVAGNGGGGGVSFTYSLNLVR